MWFSEGKYVKRAMELKMMYKPLTPLQQEKYNLMMQPEPVVEEPVVEEPVVAEPVVAEPVVAEPVVAEPVIAEQVIEEPVIAEPVIAEPVIEEKEAPLVLEDSVIVVEEVSAEEQTVPEVEQAPKSLSIEEMLQEWEAKQKENAEMIREKVEQVELEKAELAAEKAAEPEEEDDFFLPDDIRQLMEELESESEVIEAKKIADKAEAEAVKEKPQPLLQKVVEKFSTMELPKIELPVIELPEVEEIPEVLEEEPKISQSVVEIAEELPPIEEEPGIRLGDTQSMAAVAKALKNNVEAEIPEEPVESVREKTSKKALYDTGFIVKGRYDLEAQSEVGLKAGLTEEQKKLYSYFVPVHGMSEQLVEVLQSDKHCKSRYGTSRIGNLLVIGRKGSGKTVLAVDVVKAIQKSRKLKQGKMGIVTADSLNKKDIYEIAEKLHGGAIIIEKASKLNRRSIEDLCEVMEGQTGEMLVVLEDERRPLEELLEAYPQFSKKFTSRLELPVFINDELVTFGQTYAKENGYKIDEMGILALYSRIDMLQREERVVAVADVKEIIDEAIENAHRSSFKKVMQKLMKKNKDDDDRVILKEEDFR